MKRLLILTGALLFSATLLFSQSQPVRSLNAAEIRLALKKFNVVGNALYVAAHPDDENTRMITYLANEQGLNTTYLSLTRGDGGQNLIGKEVRELLGIIRTQELLAARRLDGGNQLFSRSNDFGFSKNPTETFTIWDKEKVLADAVWAIRSLRPDVIITRFSPDRAGKTHGHHTASAIIAKEAFKAAANPNIFPEQLQYVEPWQAKRVVWNASWWHLRRDSTLNAENMLSLDAGPYNALMGFSYGEIAAMSRSMHKSQGFGASLQRGQEIEYISHIDGEKAKKDILEGIDLSWNRVNGGEVIAEKTEKVIDAFDIVHPQKSIPQLLEIKKELALLPQSNFYVQQKKRELDNIILQCAGIWADVTSNDFSAAPSDSVFVTARIIQRNGYPVTLKSIDLGLHSMEVDTVLETNKLRTETAAFVLPGNMPYSQPYWLVESSSKGMYQVENQSLIGLPENPASVKGVITFEIEGELITQKTPLLYKSTDPVEGERYRPFEVSPPVTTNIAQPVFLFATEQPKEISLLVKSHTTNLKGEVSLEIPEGWRTEPTTIPVEIEDKYGENTVVFQLFPPKEGAKGNIKAVFKTDEGKKYTYALTRIEYQHIPVQTLYPTAEAQVVRLDITTNQERIGYIPGAGDVIPETLREIGYTVDILSDEDLYLENFKQYDVIITGVRAYNTNPRLKYAQPELMEFVKQGGNMVIQYNTSRRLVTEDLGPYPLKLSRDRVTVEEAPVKFLDKNHPILNYPNQLDKTDFEGWVQERGLYFPNEWDEKYTALFEMHDPGEDERKGSLLATEYGEGTFIYTGLSFFRELPAGVPGAYRLFINLISYKQKEKATEASGGR